MLVSRKLGECSGKHRPNKRSGRRPDTRGTSTQGTRFSRTKKGSGTGDRDVYHPHVVSKTTSRRTVRSNLHLQHTGLYSDLPLVLTTVSPGTYGSVPETFLPSPLGVFRKPKLSRETDGTSTPYIVSYTPMSSSDKSFLSYVGRTPLPRNSSPVFPSQIHHFTCLEALSTPRSPSLQGLSRSDLLKVLTTTPT